MSEKRRQLLMRRDMTKPLMELAPLPGLHHADFTAAKLVHALMGLAQRSLRL